MKKWGINSPEGAIYKFETELNDPNRPGAIITISLHGRGDKSKINFWVEDQRVSVSRFVPEKFLEKTPAVALLIEELKLSLRKDPDQFMESAIKRLITEAENLLKRST